MASGPITSWEIDGETVADFIFWGSKITADGDCRHEIKRHLLLGRKVMTNLDSIFKSRDITLPTKIHLVKAMVSSGTKLILSVASHSSFVYKTSLIKCTLKFGVLIEKNILNVSHSLTTYK